MKLLKAGDKKKAICESCKAIVPTTYAYRDVPFRHSKGVVKDLLVAVCDQCDDVVAIPAQSTPAIAAAKESKPQPLEVMLPAPYVDMLDMGGYRIDPKANSRFRKSLLAFYIHKHAHALEELEASGLAKIASGIVAERKGMKSLPVKRLSFKFTDHLMNDIELLGNSLSLKKTDLVASIARKIEQDIIEPKEPAFFEELKNLAVVANA